MSQVDLLQEALALASRGFYIFPLHDPIWRERATEPACSCGRAPCASIGKHPRTRRGEKDATLDVDQIRAWWTKWRQANIGLATGPSDLCVLDLDGPEAFAELAAAAGEEGVPVTLAATTGRGVHLVYQRLGARIVSVQRKGRHLGTRASTGYVVAPPSLHASGKRYAWIDVGVPIAPVPAWVAGFASGSGVAKAGLPIRSGSIPDSPRKVLGDHKQELIGHKGLPRLADVALEGLGSGEPYSIGEATRLASALAAVPADLDGRTWASWGRALFDLEWLEALPGGGTVDVGLELWDAWSRTSSGEGGKYKGRHDLEKRWASFERHSAEPYTGPRVTAASIYKEARANGWNDGAIGAITKPFGVDIKVNKEENTGHINGVAALPASMMGATDTNPLIKLNERYCTIGDVGGKCLVMSWVPSKAVGGVRVPSFQSFKAFTERYAHKYVTVKVPKKEEVVEESRQMGAHWLKWPLRRSYEGIDLVPGAAVELPNGYLNLWTGFGVEPCAGSWDLMKAHILEVLAAGDHAAAEYIYRFAAWTVQRPDEQAGVALVFKGGKGSGKGTFGVAMANLFGQHGLHIFSPKHLVGNFNGHLRNCILLFADEAFWAGDKQGESVLKGMLTEPTLFIEQKGIDAMQWKNRLHVIMSANADWIVPTSHDERRYAVFNVSDHRVNDFAYFAALHAELKAGGLGAMLRELMAVDLGAWHPRAILRTKALQDQKAHSLAPIAAWWESLLQTGQLPDDTTDIAAAVLIDSARAFSFRPGEVNATSLGRFLRTNGWGLNKGRNRNSWSVPPFKEAREAWEAKFGVWDWHDQFNDWQPYKPERVK